MLLKLSDQNISACILKSDNYPPKRLFEVRDVNIAGLVLLVWPSGAMTFCLRYRNREGRAKKFTIGRYGSITVSKARELAKEQLGRVASGIDVQLQKKLTKLEARGMARSSVRYFVDNKYKSWIVSERKTGAAILKRLEANFGQWFDKPKQEITPWLLTSWRSARIKSGTKPATVNRDINALKAMLSKAVEWGDLDVNPLANLKPLKVDKVGVVRYLSPVEEDSLRKGLVVRQEVQRQARRQHNKWLVQRNVVPRPEPTGRFTDYLMPMVLVALNTGLRRGELFNLRFEDINFQQAFLSVLGPTSKSGSTRHVPLNTEAKDVLQTWCDEQCLDQKGLVFRSPVTGVRLDNIRKSWAALIELCGIKKFRFHDLRHSFASKLVMKGADIYVVKELLGHSSIETTQRYAHLAPEHKAKTVELLNG
ncbi:MAG TPA: hypothetical protein DCE52_17635 [Rhodobacteraceae bacterium]|jgi:integrase|nr:site-specific integrase [Pseudomonadales bacterium]MDC3365205.1 site-specific integrase [Pseudomonadales bacterium]HAB39791.1 hypothetical protein [Paracoccaceae bacterium]